MSKASWCTVSPSSGTGNKTVSVSGTEHTGRIQRETTISVETTTGSPKQTKTISITQQPLAEFINGTTLYEIEFDRQGIGFRGYSNSKKLTLTFSGMITTLRNFRVNNVDAESGVNITGDPGATAQYSWYVEAMGWGTNTTISKRTGTVTLTCEDSTKALVVTIQQAEGEASLTVSTELVTLTAAGTADMQLNIASNASWTIL